MDSDVALLILDAQVNMFEDSAGLFRGGEVLQNISILITRSRSGGLLVIYIQNNGGVGDPDMPDSQGWQIHPMIAPILGDVVLQKDGPDAFQEAQLQRELKMHGIRRLIIAGMQTEICINATLLRATALGYEVTIVKDAHSTFDNDGIAAAQLVAQYNEAWRHIAKLQDTKDITF